ncbi:peroxisomal biogenesis factor 19 [Lutzomyia longipalpis]|uniref:Peroxin-19 n=3 Tax=Lutzomyia longipalpis TaxID=7200 RepID=A0A1B0CDN0_LUTLO|nr:peroxisomal biogenesis factor 19 [Lutzomyia longipalpis]
MSAKEEKGTDKELDDLLDSALEDFDKADDAAKGESSEKGNSALPVPEAAQENPWDEEFIKSQMKMFEDRMAKMFEGGAEDGFQKMAEAAAMALNPSTENVSDPQFTQTLTEALRGLSEGAESLQSPFSPDDITEMFGNVDLAGGSGENNAFLPFMQSMMQSLLSAEVLLPSLQDLVSKYPKWLEENGSKVPAADKERYEKQHELLKTVCGELEKESPNDTPEMKKQQFQKVFESMQKMQELGQPPAELMDVNIDPTQLSNPNQCPMM